MGRDKASGQWFISGGRVRGERRGHGQTNSLRIIYDVSRPKSEPPATSIPHGIHQADQMRAFTTSIGQF